MPVMSKKKQPFILDHDLSANLKPYLPADARTTVECSLRANAPDYPDVVDLCQRKRAMLITADTEFPEHLKRYQREHNECCRGLVLLPGDEMKQMAVLKKIKEGRLNHPPLRIFHFDLARHQNLFVNLRANPPEVTELCDCEWDDE